MAELSPVGTASLTTSRIEALSDGIFGTLFVVLVFELRVEDVVGAVSVRGALLKMAPKLVAYAISFAVLGVLWIGHSNQFAVIRRSDRGFLWLNLAFLSSVAFVPFAAALLGTHGLHPVAIVFYGALGAITGLLLGAIWTHAVTGHRLVDKGLDQNLVVAVRRRIKIGPVAYAFAILLAFVRPEISIAIFALVPVLYTLAPTFIGRL